MTENQGSLHIHTWPHTNALWGYSGWAWCRHTVWFWWPGDTTVTGLNPPHLNDFGRLSLSHFKTYTRLGANTPEHTKLWGYRAIQAIIIIAVSTNVYNIWTQTRLRYLGYLVLQFMHWVFSIISIVFWNQSLNANSKLTSGQLRKKCLE